MSHTGNGESNAALQRIERAEKKEEHAANAVQEAERLLQEAQKRLDDRKKTLVEASATLKQICEENCDAVVQDDSCFWNSKYQELVKFKDEHGDCLVIRNPLHKDDYIRKLGTWVGLQRRFYRQTPKQIPLYRIILLDRIGFDWDPQITQSETRFKELEAYIAEHGHCKFPARYDPNQSLCNWVRDLRRTYRDMNENKANIKKRKLTPEQILRFETAGLTWDNYEQEFKEGLEELRMYKAVHGDCHVPEEFPQNKALEVWVAEIRTAYKRYAKGKTTGCPLNNDRVQILEREGFAWHSRDAVWDRSLQQFILHLRKHGNCHAANVRDEGFYRWAIQQRYDRRTLNRTGKGPLTPWRVLKLEETNFFKYFPLEGNLYHV
jgi:hypothetical protein